jgi:tRNA(Ile)-lysidine synthase
MQDEVHATETIHSEIRRFISAFEVRTIAVAVSGGPDSTALLYALASSTDLSVVAIHVNHKLRGKQSDDDEAWLSEFCVALDVPLRVLDGSLDPEQVRIWGIEAAARRRRYELLGNEREECGADLIATAHTMSDQAETVLLRLITGRGTSRLAGIRPETEDKLIRPLLQVERSTIEAYIEENELEPRHDATNDDGRFLRNRIRHHLIPMLLDWNPAIVGVLSDTAAFERDRSTAFNALIEPLRQKAVTRQDERSSIEIDLIDEPHILRTLIAEEVRRLDPDVRELDYEGLTQRAHQDGPATRTVSTTLRVERDEREIVISRTPEPREAPEFAYAIEPGRTLMIEEIGLTVSITAMSDDNVRQLASNDRMRQTIQLPLGDNPRFEVRNRRPGDRFRPLGMDREKNLADFLIDRRIPEESRAFLPLLVCNGTIAWIGGVEVADEFRVRSCPGTRLDVKAERLGGKR